MFLLSLRRSKDSVTLTSNNTSLHAINMVIVLLGPIAKQPNLILENIKESLTTDDTVL